MHGSMLKHHKNMLETNLDEVIFWRFLSFLSFFGLRMLIPLPHLHRLGPDPCLPMQYTNLQRPSEVVSVHGSMLKHHKNMLETHLDEVIFWRFLSFFVIFRSAYAVPAIPHVQMYTQPGPDPCLQTHAKPLKKHFSIRFSPAQRSRYILSKTEALGAVPQTSIQCKPIAFFFPPSGIFSRDFNPPP